MTAILRALSRLTMSVSAARVTAGSVPRRASLAPSSTITASVPSGTDQSSRSRPPEEVSPETPALIMSTSTPLSFKAFCKRAGNAAWPDRPRPSLKESPRTTILTGCANTGPAVMRAAINTSMCMNNRVRLSTAPAKVPYDRAMDSLIEPSLIEPTQLGRLAPDTISISNVNLSLGAGAARVHILKDISLRVASGEAIGLIGPSGSGKSTLLMVMAGLERPDSGEVVVNGTAFNALDEDDLARFRGRQVGIVFQSFHLIPTMTALENVAVPLELAGNTEAAARASSLAFRYAFRELRGGLRGFYVFIACIALGVMAIAGVGSVAASLGDGLAREGRTLLGGDVAFSMIQREAKPDDVAFLRSRGQLSVAATLRAMARAGGGRRALIELKAVDSAYPMLGELTLDPGMPLAELLAERDGAFGAAADSNLMARLDLKTGDRVTVGRETF